MRYIYAKTFQDGNGVVVGTNDAGKVTVYLAGTTTLATIYTAASGGSADSDSIIPTTDSGSFSFYVDEADYLSSQLFDVVLSATNFESKTLSNVAILPRKTLNTASKTATYTVTLADEIVFCDGTFTVTLPAVATSTGKPFTIKNTGSGTITISPNIEGSGLTLSQYQVLTVISDGTNYYRMSHYA